MGWNYRIMRHRTTLAGKGGKVKTQVVYFQLHEVYYDEKGDVDGYTQDGVKAGGDTPAEVIKDLELMLRDAKKSRKDILDYKE